VFLVVVRWAMLVWEEIGRARASVSADASSRAWSAALRATYLGRVDADMRPGMAASNPGDDTLLFGTRVGAEKIWKGGREDAGWLWCLVHGKMMRRVRGIARMTGVKLLEGRTGRDDSNSGMGSGTWEASHDSRACWGSKRPRVGDLGQQGRHTRACFCCSGGLLARYSTTSRTFDRAEKGRGSRSGVLGPGRRANWMDGGHDTKGGRASRTQGATLT